MGSFKDRLREKKPSRKPHEVAGIGSCLLAGFTNKQRGVIDDLPALAKRLGIATGTLIRRYVLAWGLLNPDGSRVWEDAEMASIDELPTEDTEPLFDAICSLNNMREVATLPADPNACRSANGQPVAATSA